MNKKLTSIIASASLLLQLSAPAVFASTTLEITGNGADSDSEVVIERTSTTNVVQTNTADIKNDIQVHAETGDNDANKNTAGDVGILTGDADIAVSVLNAANKNSVDLDNCDCEGDVDVLIEGNGADSVNKANLVTSDTTLVVQDNQADIENKIHTDADTGDNNANKNTGGDVSVETGDAIITVAAQTRANQNSARIGGNGSGGSMLSARILGNGADSVNTLDLDLARSLSVVQSNEADVENDIHADADTGENDANKNTGGTVGVLTGDADILIGIDNMVNFNSADLDCDCFLEDVMAKIAGNGADSENLIAATLGDSLGVFQDNCGENGQYTEAAGGRHGHHGDCEIDNEVDADAFTGENDVNKNTGDYTGDPSVETGDAIATVLLENQGGVNEVGSESAGFEFGGTNFEFDFHLDLSDLLGLLLGL